jgi:hypothetical protein
MGAGGGGCSHQLATHTATRCTQLPVGKGKASPVIYTCHPEKVPCAETKKQQGASLVFLLLPCP